jgi:septal ring factor EnvC (AmiA/AmiB activator)
MNKVLLVLLLLAVAVAVRFAFADAKQTGTAGIAAQLEQINAKLDTIVQNQAKLDTIVAKQDQTMEMLRMRRLR